MTDLHGIGVAMTPCLKSFNTFTSYTRVNEGQAASIPFYWTIMR